MRQTVSLNGAWRFQPDWFGEGVRVGYADRVFDASLWTEVQAPCAFDDCLPGLKAYQGAGWFRRKVKVPESWQDRHVVLRFEGVNYHAVVWVNGERVGEHRDGFLRFDLPVSGALRFGKDNTVVVRVDNVRIDGEVPGLHRGWRPYGGILRDVQLMACPAFRVAHLATRAEADGRFQAVVEVAGGDCDVEARVLVVIEDDGGAQVAVFESESAPLPAGGAVTFRAAGRVNGISCWSPEDPVLYVAVARLLIDGEPVDAGKTNIGFRTIRTAGSQLMLNGNPIYLTGFNRHEDSPRTGACTDMETVRNDLETMKGAGANFVRLCHYPHHAGELDICDELGMLAMAEIPLYWWQHSREKQPELYEKTLAAARRQLASMIRRDSNHPAIVFWSVSNETSEGVDGIAEGNAALIDHVRALDDSRLAVHVSNHWRAAPHFEKDDVICVNDYPSWWQASRVGEQPVNYEECRSIWEEELAKLHEAYPARPILVTEFGGISLEGVFGCTMGEDHHAKVLDTEFAGMQAPYVCGATIWCWADHPWPEDAWVGFVTNSPFGVVSRERKPLRPLYAAETMFRMKRAQLMRKNGG